MQASFDSRIDRIKNKLDDYKDRGLRYFVSSSFQTHSIPLLHILVNIDSDTPVYFLNTGYHFPETLEFRDEVAKKLGLNLITVESPLTKLAQRDSEGRLMFHSDPDRCCYYNKVLPMEPVMKEFDVWINGVRRSQTAFRNSLPEEQPAAFNTVRYHPMLNWTAKEIWEYRTLNDLPEHPLEAKGIFSVGCMPCTFMTDMTEDGRVGRWSGMQKTECGLQTELVQKK